MILWLDHKIFGDGFGLRSPHCDSRFLWLDGELYTFMAGLGAQLHSIQWTHPRPQEERRLGGLRFRPFHSRRSWGRVMVAWACQDLPRDMSEANAFLREMERTLGGVMGFRWPCAKPL